MKGLLSAPLRCACLNFGDLVPQGTELVLQVRRDIGLSIPSDYSDKIVRDRACSSGQWHGKVNHVRWGAYRRGDNATRAHEILRSKLKSQKEITKTEGSVQEESKINGNQCCKQWQRTNRMKYCSSTEQSRINQTFRWANSSRIGRGGGSASSVTAAGLSRLLRAASTLPRRSSSSGHCSPGAGGTMTSTGRVVRALHAIVGMDSHKQRPGCPQEYEQVADGQVSTAHVRDA